MLLVRTGFVASTGGGQPLHPIYLFEVVEVEELDLGLASNKYSPITSKTLYLLQGNPISNAQAISEHRQPL
jgi:hypothetical protein